MHKHTRRAALLWILAAACTPGEDDTAPETTTTPALTDATSDGTADEATTGGEATTDDEPTTGAADGPPPASILDLAAWRLILPIAGESPDAPLEVHQPELATYALDPWFVVADDHASVRFRAAADGVPTAGSDDPRSELREEAAWSAVAGVHTLTVTQAITHLPDAAPAVVAGQIQAADAVIVAIRLADNHLFVEGDGIELGDLDPDYALGAPFTLRLRVADGNIDIYYDDMLTPALSLPTAATDCVFTAGVRTRANPDPGDAADAYGEVEISELVVTHE